MSVETKSKEHQGIYSLAEENKRIQKFLFKEYLSIERRRALIFGIFLGMLFVLLLGLGEFGLLSSEMYQLVYGFELRFFLQAFILVSIVFELALGHSLNRLILKRHQLRPFLFLMSFIETSLPSMVIFFFAYTIDPVSALLGPATLVYGGLITLSVLHLDYILSLFTGFVAAFQYYLLALFFLRKEGGEYFGHFFHNPTLYLFKAFVLIATALITALISYELTRRNNYFYRLLSEKKYLLNLLGQHLSKKVVTNILQDNNPSNDLVEVCVMFIDLRGFSAYAEKKEPKEVFNSLGTVFDQFIRIVNEEGGVVLKFLGDGFMAVFGPPFYQKKDYCQRAFDAGEKLLKSKETWRHEVDVTFPNNIGVGLHVGEAMAGVFGPGSRKEFSLLGDVVNIASRLESLNKRFDSQMVISKKLFNRLEVEPRDGLEERVKIKGREKPIDIYAFNRVSSSQ